MSGATRGRPLYLGACAVALIVLAATYANHFRNEFHFDDSHTIQNNLYIRDLRNIPLFFLSARTFSSNPAHQSYRPLLTTTLAIDYRLGHGLDPVAFHATSFGLFAAQCILMVFLFRRLMDRARPHPWNRWLALFASSWYALHAANAETVNYVVARSEILSTLGVVISLLMFTSTGRARHWALCLIPAGAAVLGKEQGAMAAPLIFLYVALFERELSLRDLVRPRQAAAVLAETWPAFFVCGALVLAGLRLADSWVPGGTSRGAYLLTQPFVVTHYALTFVLPVNLSADTDWSLITNPFDDRVLVGLIFVGCALWIAGVASRRRDTRPITYGVLWFFLALLPTSSLVPLAEVLNDHRVYFPFVGLVLAVVWALGVWLMNRDAAIASRQLARAAVTAAAVSILAAHAYGAHQRNIVWHTGESLWLDVTTKSPANARGLMNYGLAQMAKGNLTVAGHYFDRAQQLAPRYPVLHVNLAILDGMRGDDAGAERHFRQAQRYDPGNPSPYFYYGRWLHSVGRSDEAAATVRHAVELSPADIDARHLLLEILGRGGDWSGVASIARDTLQIEPGDPAALSWLAKAEAPRPPRAARASRHVTAEQWLALSQLQFRNAEFEDSLESAREAIRQRSENPDAYNNVCAAENELGHYVEAAAACERALALDPEFPLARHNLALANAKRQGWKSGS